MAETHAHKELLQMGLSLWLLCGHNTSVPKHSGVLPLSSALLPRLYLLCLKGSGDHTATIRVAWYLWCGQVHDKHPSLRGESPGGAQWVEAARSRTRPRLMPRLHSWHIHVSEAGHPTASLPCQPHTCFISSSRTTAWLIFSSEGFGGLPLSSKAVSAKRPLLGDPWNNLAQRQIIFKQLYLRSLLRISPLPENLPDSNFIVKQALSLS